MNTVTATPRSYQENLLNLMDKTYANITHRICQLLLPAASRAAVTNLLPQAVAGPIHSAALNGVLFRNRISA